MTFFKSAAALLFSCCTCSIVSAQPAGLTREHTDLVRDAGRAAAKLERTIAEIEQRIDELDTRKGGLQWVADLIRHVESNPEENNQGKALWRIGDMFESGAEDMGLEPDPFEAVGWYQKAATWHNHVQAQYALGLMYLEGRGNGKNGTSRVAQNTAEAAKWLQKAAQQNHPQAQYLMAILHAKGLGVRKSQEQAETWLGKAAQNGMKTDRETFGKLTNAPFSDWIADWK